MSTEEENEDAIAEAIKRSPYRSNAELAEELGCSTYRIRNERQWLKDRGEIKSKNEIIAEALRRAPDRSNSWIAREVGFSPHTVKKVRVQLKEEGELESRITTEGSDGKYRPAERASDEVALAWLRKRYPEEWGKARMAENKWNDIRKGETVIMLFGRFVIIEPWLDEGRLFANHLACLVPCWALPWLPHDRKENRCTLARVVLFGDLAWAFYDHEATGEPVIEWSK